MSARQSCIARAEEAEGLAALASYERDRVWLTSQAIEWRARAAGLQAGGEEAPEAAQRSWLGRLSEAWRYGARRRRAG